MKKNHSKPSTLNSTNTIVDVAEMAGVAVGTVSRYLNGFTIRPANRIKIEEAIDVLKYKRSAVAVALKTDVTHMIGFLAICFDEFHGSLLEELSRALRQNGRALISYCHGGDPKLKADGLEFFANQRIDALVMSGSTQDLEKVGQLAIRGLPIILYDSDLKTLKADRVFVNNREVSYQAVRHLLDIGHRKIAIITGDANHSTSSERYQGYCDALQERKLDIDPQYVLSGRWTSIGGHEATQRFMSLTSPPTAIYSASFPMTLGALRYFKENNIRLPSDVSLISFDDPLLFGLYEPGITCIAQPIKMIAQTIAQTIENRLSNHYEAPPQSIRLPCSIILRNSAQAL